MNDVNLAEMWNKVKETTENVELDVLKGAAGNTSAQARARKGLRVLKREVADLVKEFQNASNEIKAARKAKKEASHVE